MSRLAIALALALFVTAANAQNFSSEKSPGAADADGMRPFLFDARLPGDEIRERAVRNRQPVGGTIVVPPKASQPQRER
jgi:hypothetical protein